MLESVSSYALAAGVAALFNPCSLLLFPAWLAMVAARGSNPSAAAALRQSVPAALVLTGGYIVAFSLALLAAGTPDSASGVLAYISAGTGMLLVLLASFLIAGGRVPMLQATTAGSGAKSGLAGLAGVGAVIGLASLAPQFPELLAGPAAEDGAEAEASVAGIIAYVLGLLAAFGLFCSAAAWLGFAAGHRWPLSGTVLDRAQGYLLLLAGLGTAYYAFFAVRNAAGTNVEDRLVDAAHGVHGALTDALRAVPAWLVVVAYLMLTGWILLPGRRPAKSDGGFRHHQATVPVAPVVPTDRTVPAPIKVRSRRRPLPEESGDRAATLQDASRGLLETEEHRPRHFNPQALRRARDIPSGPRVAVRRRVLRAEKRHR